MPGALIARRDYAEENPEMVARYLAVFLRGVEWIRDNNDEAVSMMADFYALTGVELDDEYCSARSTRGRCSRSTSSWS